LLLGAAFGFGLLGRDRLLDIFQHQSELVGIDLFGTGAKAMALKRLDDGGQPFVLDALGDHQRLERAGIVGERFSSVRHDKSESYSTPGVANKI
jgi:hypothetical protein